jgi:hypothetical protein
MSVKDAQEKIVANMKRWQKIEDASIASTTRVIESTDNPIVQLVMEIIQRDSQMHHRVQGLIVESLESRAIALTPEELAKVWELIERHIEIEKETIELANLSLKATEGAKGMVVQRYLLEYLLADEEKHDALLAKLSEIKQGMYPYG